MTDALHRCDDCGLVDLNVSVRREGKNGYYYMHGDEGDCLAAALRQLTAANALIGRCRLQLNPLPDMMEQDGEMEAAEFLRALLADIDAALGRG